MDENQRAYDFIENGDDERAARFYDFVWKRFRNHMRVLIVAYVETEEGRKAFEEYVEAHQ